MSRKLHKNNFCVGQVVTKVGRPGAPLARIIKIDGDKITIQYLDEKKTKETYAVDQNGYDRYVTPVYPETKDVFINEEKKTVVVVWPDGQKTKAVALHDDKFDLAEGLYVCLVKHLFPGAPGACKKKATKVLKEKARAAKAKADAEKAKADAKAKVEAKVKAKADAKKAKEDREKAIADALTKIAEKE